jgi:RNA polymerase sigma-70 factor (ECF subfamily)
MQSDMHALNQTVLEAARSGDRNAIATLVRTSHRPLRALVASLLLDSHDVDDVAQDVFLWALERLDKVDDVQALAAFLRGIARNVVRERRRKFAREESAFARLVFDRHVAAATTESEAALSDPETLKALQACLERLPDRSREMLELRYSEELNSEQIGGQLSLNGTAVRAALRRARVTLLDCLRSSCPTAGETA